MNWRWTVVAAVWILLLGIFTGLGLLLVATKWKRGQEPAFVGVERSLAEWSPDPHFHARLLQAVGPILPPVDGHPLGPQSQRWLLEIEIRNSAVRQDPPFVIDPRPFELTIRDAQGQTHYPVEGNAAPPGETTVRRIEDALPGGETHRYRFAFTLPPDSQPREVWFSRRDRFTEALPWWENTPLHPKAVWQLLPESPTEESRD